MLIRFFAFLIFSSSLHAANLYSLDEHKVLETPIAIHGLTRIAVEEDRIHQVFGLSHEYFLETDETQGQIFLQPLGQGAINPFSLTVITEGGRTQDFRFIPKDKSPETLVLRFQENPIQVPKSEPITRKEVKGLILACSEENTPYGFSNILVDVRGSRGPTQLIKQIESSKLRAQVYEIKNLTDRNVCIHPEDFAAHKNTLALAVTQKFLKPGEEGRVYVVSSL